MRNIKKLQILSFAKFQAILIAQIGIVAGILYSFGGAIYDISTIGLNSGTALAFLAPIGMPVIFGVFGFILGIVEAVLYNLSTSWFGGIGIDFEQ